MKVLRCKEVGEPNCIFYAEGRSSEEVERKMLDHMQERHSIFIEPLSFEEREKLLEQMEAMVEER